MLSEAEPPIAWQRAVREAIDAHLARDDLRRDHWKAVQFELSRRVPSPVPGDLDIYRAAQLLILVHGHKAAWKDMMEKAAREDGNIMHQAISLRVADAIAALSPGGAEEGRVIQ